MSEAKAGNQIGLRPECSFTKTAFNAAQTRPALIIGVNIGLALKPRCIQKQPVFPVHAATQASWNWSRLASPKLEEKAPYFCF